MSNLNLNKVVIGGRMTADPELKTTTNGTSVCAFTVAVNRKASSASGEKQTDFLNCVAWRQTAEFVSKYFRKCSSICVIGSVQTRSYTDRNDQKRVATEIIIDEALFVDSKSETPSAPIATPPQSNYVPDAYKTSFEAVSDDDDLPF